MRIEHLRGWFFFATLLVSIEASAGKVSTDGSLGPAQTLSGPNYQIGPGLGRLVGPNLFQSFSAFDLDKGDIATFTAPAGVQNILARVTSGAASNIDGTIATRLAASPGTPHPASFYLMNPAGVIFGPDARLSVGGSFIVTTADSVHLADGAIFSATPTNADALLTTAAPAAFGFLSTRPAGVTLNGAALAVPTGKSIISAAGSLSITSAGSLSAPGGQIGITSVAAPATAAFDPVTLLPASAGAKLGPITLSSDAQLSADGAGGGLISIFCGDLTLSGGSSVHADTLGSATGRGVSISASGLVSLDGVDASGHLSGIDAQSDAAGPAGDAGSIAITAGSLQITGGAQISSTTFGPGNGGDVHITVAGKAVMSGADPSNSFSSGVATSSQSTAAGGNSGTISISAGSLSLLDGAQISASTDGNGRGGDVVIHAARFVDNDEGKGQFTGVFVNSGSPDIAAAGHGGDMTIDVNDLQIIDGGRLAAVAFGSGDGGSITINAASATLAGRGNDALFTGISAATEATSDAGRAGSVILRVGQLRVIGGGEIDSDAVGAGNAGAVSITAAGAMTLDARGDATFTGISAKSEVGATGNAGSVAVTASRLRMLNGAQIASSTNGPGEGGNVSVTIARSALLSGQDSQGDPSGLRAVSTDVGNAGFVTFTTGALTLSGGAEISSSAPQSHAGDVTISSRTSMSLSGSLINASSSGDGGNVSLQAGRRLFIQESGITGHAGGNGGLIHLHAPLIEIGGSLIDGLSGGRPVQVAINGRSVAISDTRILTDLPQVFPQIDIAGSLEALPSPLATGTALNPQCGVQNLSSSFTLAGAGGIAPEPGSWMPDLPLDISQATTRRR